MIWRFDHLYVDQSWKDDAFVETDSSGIITQFLSVDSADETTSDHWIRGYSVPGIPNGHSHAFQYAMAGYSESLNAGRLDDDFWSWRQNMYNLALSLHPDQMQKIATEVYREMLRCGYTWVSEFHYLHHDLDGRPYLNRSEMGQRLLAAADEAGIGITLVPVFYQKGGFGREPELHQRRFIHKSFEEYLELVEDLRPHLVGPRQKLGVGIHSLRAVDSVEEFRQFKTEPIHIHIAEQLKEISDCQDFHGARPVEHLIQQNVLAENWHLVHATHVLDQELQGIIDTKANVIVCPSTEGNLGDGIFPLAQFHQMGGNWGIGSDSHVGLNPFEELRWMDYTQRMTRFKRNVLCHKANQDSGSETFIQALNTGAASQGRIGGLRVGESLDVISLRGDYSLLQNCQEAQRLSVIVYTTQPHHYSSVIAGGQMVHPTD